MKRMTDQELLKLVKDALMKDQPLNLTIQAIERQIIYNANRRHKCHQDAFKALNLAKSTYYHKMKYLHLDHDLRSHQSSSRLNQLNE